RFSRTVPLVGTSGLRPTRRALCPTPRAALGLSVTRGGSGLRRARRPARAGRFGAYFGPYLFAGFLGRDGTPATRHALAGATGLPLTDGGDQVALAHPPDAGDAQRRGEALQLGEQHRRQSGAAPAAGSRGCLVRNLRRHVGGVAQWIPSLDGSGLPGHKTRPGGSGYVPLEPTGSFAQQRLIKGTVVRRTLVGVGRAHV